MAVMQDLVNLEKDFDSLYEDTSDLIVIDDMQLKEGLKTQIQLEIQWERLAKKIKRIRDEYEQLTEEAYSDSISEELKNSYRSSSIQEAREFAKTNPRYRESKRVYIKAKNLYDEANGILEIIESRRYVLNNMTNSMVASVEKTII